MNFSNPIIWVFLPTPLSLEIIDNLNSKVIIYYCIDNFRVSSVSAKKIMNSEIKLLNKADLIFVTSRELLNYCVDYKDRVHFFPFAVNFQEFERIRLSESLIPGEIKDIKKPIIGYVGGVHKWIDFNLIKEIAQKCPEYSFVFIGPIQTDITLLSELKNIYFLGKKEHDKIPRFIKYFDVCIVPYLIADYTKNVYPTKLNEYLAMGKSVVSTDLPEIKNFNIENDNLVLVGKTYQEFINCIHKVIKDSDDTLVKKSISVAKNNSWINRIEEMNKLIAEAIDRKAKMSFDWRTGFLKVYKAARKRFLKIAFIFLSIYFLIFYTPFVWFLASPLKISQPPKKVDCIVVFAGGVGESGKAGESYIERVKYAAELHKKGYAQNMIFSSGYTYVFKEPMVMKALAVALGVPEETIILEDKAKNTYENVKFTKNILDKERWNKILLVSSTYHMRRASLVFNKIAKDIKIYYTPIPESVFYYHPVRDAYGKKIWKRANLQQIRAILHEYLGILYYWYKGRI